jgi:glycosyltransferase involved in cell wall biosynthesis
MKILFISNFYPPHHIGGYELGAYAVHQELIKHGHKVTVLTSNYGTMKSPSIDGIRRNLAYSFDSSRLVSITNLVRNATLLRWTIKQELPDLVICWGLLFTSFGLLYTLPTNKPILLYISDNSYIHGDPAFRMIAKMIKIVNEFSSLVSVNLKKNPIDLVATSEYIKQNLVTTEWYEKPVRVVNWGLLGDLRPLKPVTSNLRIVLGGRLSEDKGQLFALRVLQHILANNMLNVSISIRLLSDIGSDDYSRLVQTEVGLLAKHCQVCVGAVTHCEVNGILSESDVFILPSKWQEPFSTMLVQALCNGCVCVAGDVGGNAEAFSGISGHYLCENSLESWQRAILNACQESDFTIEQKMIRRQQSLLRYEMSEMVNQLLSGYLD